MRHFKVILIGCSNHMISRFKSNSPLTQKRKEQHFAASNELVIQSDVTNDNHCFEEERILCSVK